MSTLRLRSHLAPTPRHRWRPMLSLSGALIAARRGGAAVEPPRTAIWPNTPILEPENELDPVDLGSVSIFADSRSEPELLIAVGAWRFARIAGPLPGNPVPPTNDDLPRLTRYRQDVLIHEMLDLRINRTSGSHDA